MVVCPTRDTAISNFINYNPHQKNVLFEKGTFLAYPESVGRKKDVYKTLPELAGAIQTFVTDHSSHIRSMDTACANTLKSNLLRIANKIFLKNSALGSELRRAIQGIGESQKISKETLISQNFQPIYVDAIFKQLKKSAITIDELEAALNTPKTNQLIALSALESALGRKALSSLLEVSSVWIDGEEEQTLEEAMIKSSISYKRFLNLHQVAEEELAWAEEEELDNGEYFLEFISPNFEPIVAKKLLDFEIDGKTLLDQINDNPDFDIEEHEDKIVAVGNLMTGVALINDKIIDDLVAQHGKERVYAAIPPLHPLKILNPDEISI